MAAGLSLENLKAGHAAVALFELTHGHRMDPPSRPRDACLRLGIAGWHDHVASESKRVGGERFMSGHRHSAKSVRTREIIERVQRQKSLVSEVSASGEKVEEVRGQGNGLDSPTRGEHRSQLNDGSPIRALRHADEKPALRGEHIPPVETGGSFERSDRERTLEDVYDRRLFSTPRSDCRTTDDRPAVQNTGPVLDENGVGMKIVARKLEDLEPDPAESCRVTGVLRARELEIDRRRRRDARQRLRVCLPRSSDDGTRGKRRDSYRNRIF